MPDNKLAPARGKGPNTTRVHSSVAADLNDGDTYDTGLSSIDAANLTGTVDDEIITIGGITDGVVTVNIADNAGGAGTQQDVHVVAFGEP